MAFLLCKTVDNCAIPCSVNAYGKVGRYFSGARWLQFATTLGLSLTMIVWPMFLRSQFVTLNELLHPELVET